MVSSSDIINLWYVFFFNISIVPLSHLQVITSHSILPVQETIGLPSISAARRHFAYLIRYDKRYRPEYKCRKHPNTNFSRLSCLPSVLTAARIMTFFCEASEHSMYAGSAFVRSYSVCQMFKRRISAASHSINHLMSYLQSFETVHYIKR